MAASAAGGMTDSQGGCPKVSRAERPPLARNAAPCKHETVDPPWKQ